PFMGGQQTNNTSELSFMNTTNIFTPPTTTQGGLNIPDMNSLAKESAIKAHGAFPITKDALNKI
ncbi:MAG: hypothetical protein U9O94_03275, partial [Nanoarchaeota archaeon]|nr:hypothetical protein [Nanoarchaeota archaeon]